ncbi:MAG: lipopolysaccharide heptosyltransferase II [Gammaproteobacteria bacterium]|nr:lipopolysaccharide heptosyltransferase II [Gammaproteobacteria bacterium]
MTSPRPILVVGPAWVGDMVMAQSLFMALHARLPDAAIDVLAPAWSLPLLSRMDEVRRGVALRAAHGELAFSARRGLGKSLRAEGYQQAIVLPRSLKAALVPFFARIPRRTGYCGEWRYGLINDVRPLDKQVLTQTVQRFVALGLPPESPLPPPIPKPHLRVDHDNQARLVRELGLDLSRPAVAFMPGAEYGPAKRWPSSYYGQIATQLHESGYQIWLLGSANDSEAAVTVMRATRAPLVDLCGKTRLEDAVDLLGLASAAVTNDSGLMHVAAAVGTPLLAIYGSSTPDYTPPLTEHAVVMYDRLSCSPCFKRTCPKRNTQCLTHIGPDRAWPVLADLLGIG